MSIDVHLAGEICLPKRECVKWDWPAYFLTKSILTNGSIIVMT
jgi:hypothetical protein